jgi:hypothetical protein
MTGYRIIPKRHAYNVEQTEAGDVWVVLRTWPTEELAVSHLRELQAAAAETEPQPPPERPRGRQIGRYRTTRYG